MRYRAFVLKYACILLLLTSALWSQNVAAPPSASSSSTVGVEKGSLVLHLLLHAIGKEEYEVKKGENDGLVMETSFEYSDRGRSRAVGATLRMSRDFTPQSLEVKGRNSTTSPNNLAEIINGKASINEDGTKREIALPQRFFLSFGYTPFSMQMMMLRYWNEHGRPSSLPMLRANPLADDLPVQIRIAGHDALSVDGKKVQLTRYTIANLAFGREIVWLNEQQQLAAVMTFGGGLPFEAIRKEYEPALTQLVKSGVTQEMKNLSELQRQVPPEASGSFAIVGSLLVDGTGRAAVPDSVVVVRKGRIAAVGTRSEIKIPHGMKIVNANGQTLLPGLWEMHTHYSGVEFGPALLAAGITTARDCGGEFEFLTTLRDAIDKQDGLGPRLLLAGLVDASGPDAFGITTADAPEEAKAVVEKYKAAGFQQLKLYTLLKPDVVAALSAEAHRRGMTVTGHVPSSINAIQGVEAGMDQINHLGFLAPSLRGSEDDKPLDLNSEQARKAIQFFQQHKTVIDPTASWGEMAGHSKDMDIASFEPAITKAPYMVASKFTSLGSPKTESERFQARMAETKAIIGALHKAGVPIVAGSDTGLLGYGLHRELELYVQSGMTPMEAIQSATLVAARAMNLAKDSGTIEPGKRADLILVNGNPLENISNIRKVSRVIANGRMYDSAKLWKIVGFQP